MPETTAVLRAEVVRFQPKRSNLGYPPGLRARIGRWALARRRAGERWTSMASALGISTTSARSWVLNEAPPSPPSSGFLPVVVSEDSPAPPAGLGIGRVLHAPSGYRVERLGLDDLITLLRELE
jgi:hypothetical protein